MLSKEIKLYGLRFEFSNNSLSIVFNGKRYKWDGSSDRMRNMVFELASVFFHIDGTYEELEIEVVERTLKRYISEDPEVIKTPCESDSKGSIGFSDELIREIDAFPPEEYYGKWALSDIGRDGKTIYLLSEILEIADCLSYALKDCENIDDQDEVYSLYISEAGYPTWGVLCDDPDDSSEDILRVYRHYFEKNYDYFKEQYKKETEAML